MFQAGILANGGTMGAEEACGVGEEDTADPIETESGITARDSNSDNGSRTLRPRVWLLPFWLSRLGIFLRGISRCLFLPAIHQ